jgi:hypothetical protein
MGASYSGPETDDTCFQCEFPLGADRHEKWTLFLQPLGQVRYLATHRTDKNYPSLLTTGGIMTTPDGLWNFMCGDPHPYLRTVVHYPSSCLAPDTILAGLRSNMQQKVARWCAIHECAAIAAHRAKLARM